MEKSIPVLHITSHVILILNYDHIISTVNVIVAIGNVGCFT